MVFFFFFFFSFFFFLFPFFFFFPSDFPPMHVLLSAFCVLLSAASPYRTFFLSLVYPRPHHPQAADQQTDRGRHNGTVVLSPGRSRYTLHTYILYSPYRTVHTLKTYSSIYRSTSPFPGWYSNPREKPAYLHTAATDKAHVPAPAHSSGIAPRAQLSRLSARGPFPPA